MPHRQANQAQVIVSSALWMRFSKAKSTTHLQRLRIRSATEDNRLCRLWWCKSAAEHNVCAESQQPEGGIAKPKVVSLCLNHLRQKVDIYGAVSPCCYGQ